MIRIFSLWICLLFITANVACSQRAKNHSTAAPLDVQIGQMLNIGFRGLQLADTNHIIRDIERYHLGAVMLFDYDVPTNKPIRNIKSPPQVKQLVHDLQGKAQIPLLVSVDREGGQVSRLKQKFGFPKTVSAQYLGKLNNIDTTQFYAHKTAETLASLGINTDLAPVVDLNINPENPIIGSLGRSFSSDPSVVVNQATIFINQLHNKEIFTVLKHFPGHGSSKKDSHLGVVDVTNTWSKKELSPYKQLIDSGLVDMIMTAHIFDAKLDSVYPATLSKPTIQGILRDSLNFNGVIMSDDLMMGAIRNEYGLKTTIHQAINAGVDILSFANQSVYDPDIVPKAHRIIKELIDEGAILKNRIHQSYQRIMNLKKELK